MSVEFIDTNILVYAHAGGAGARHEIAVDLIARLAEEGTGALSTQVLAEFYATVTGKLRMKSQDAEQSIRDFGSWLVYRPAHADILNAIRLQRRYQLSWWDAMVVNSAMECGARILWTEDLNENQKFADVVVRNPFP